MLCWGTCHHPALSHPLIPWVPLGGERDFVGIPLPTARGAPSSHHHTPEQEVPPLRKWSPSRWPVCLQDMETALRSEKRKQDRECRIVFFAYFKGKT